MNQYSFEFAVSIQIYCLHLKIQFLAINCEAIDGCVLIQKRIGCRSRLNDIALGKKKTVWREQVIGSAGPSQSTSDGSGGSRETARRETARSQRGAAENHRHHSKRWRPTQRNAEPTPLHRG